jgi:protein lifeguard
MGRRQDNYYNSAYGYHEEEDQGFLGGGGNYNNGDASSTVLSENLDRSLRHGFIRKVFGIVGMQLLVTAGIGALIGLCSGAEAIFVDKAGGRLLWPYWVAQFLPCVLLLFVTCCKPKIFRQFPTNYILLFLVSLCLGVTTGVMCLAFTATSVLAAVGMTTVIVFALGLYACQTRTDFTGMGTYLYVACLVLALTGMLGFLLGAGKLMHTLISGAAVLVFSLYLVYDIQLIVGGKHRKHQFSLDDYCFAALSLYFDIINLFVHLLALFGERRR